MKKFIFSLMVVVLAFMATNNTALAQRETASGVEVETDVILLRRDLRADKKQLIALNLSLTEPEATKFWPVYDQYAAEMAKHNDEFYTLIKNYAANQKTLSDAETASMIKRWADIQVELSQTRQKYIPLVEKGHLAEEGSTVLPDRSTSLCSDGSASFVEASVAASVIMQSNSEVL